MEPLSEKECPNLKVFLIEDVKEAVQKLKEKVWLFKGIYPTTTRISKRRMVEEIDKIFGEFDQGDAICRVRDIKEHIKECEKELEEEFIMYAEVNVIEKIFKKHFGSLRE